ncbi:hypothetical protein QTP88_022700 [Uroleucon formosanum]
MMSSEYHTPNIKQQIEQSLSHIEMVQLPTNAFQENYDISLSKNDELVQPEMLFPATNGRRFTSRHYKVYNWIEYSVSKDEIFCFPCRHFFANIIASGKTAGNLCFVNYGSKCKNWKEQTLSLNNHQRYKELNIYERSIGCYHMENSNTESLASEIIKIPSINKLDIMNCIGQCYDGASVMSGQYSGVQERIRSKVPHAIYVHCYDHRLNLCLVQTLQNIPYLCNFFNTIQNLYKSLINGQTRYKLFVRAQKDKQIPVIYLERLVETRWPYWYKSIQKVNMRFIEILEVLSILSHQGDQTARAIGILNEISNISFIKISHAMEILLQTIHCASVELQGASIIQSSAVNLLQNKNRNIQKMRSDTFWDKINNSAKLVAEKNEIVYENNSRNRRPVRLNKNLQDYFVQSTIGQGTFENNSNTSIENNLPLTNLKIIFYTAIDG